MPKPCQQWNSYVNNTVVKPMKNDNGNIGITHATHIRSRQEMKTKSYRGYIQQK